MKNTIKLFGVLLITFGVFVAIGSVSASTADLLQPAGATTGFESIRVGVAGEGGVTFFNGSVLNESGPYVIADDLRVEGQMWRGEKGGDDPLKISDHLIPTINNTNNLGSTTNRWYNLYVSEGFYGDFIELDRFISATYGEFSDGVHTPNIGNFSSMEPIDISSLLRLRGIGGGHPYACNSTHRGEMYFSIDESRFYGCNVSGWVRLDN